MHEVEFRTVQRPYVIAKAGSHKVLDELLQLEALTLHFVSALV